MWNSFGDPTKARTDMESLRDIFHRTGKTVWSTTQRESRENTTPCFQKTDKIYVVAFTEGSVGSAIVD